MNEPALSSEQIDTLIELLQKRLEVIGDKELRDSDPDEQLRQLQAISEAISAFHHGNQGVISPRLNHFLGNCSFDKALDWVRGDRAKC
ncbi:MAG: hypothetical protein AAGA96_12350 [Verrucomicrobiota bacterium]